jgi:hypothetical protein
MRLRRFVVLDKGEIVLLETPIWSSAFNRFAAFAMVDVYRQVFARIAINAAVCSFTTVYEKFMFTHDINTSVTQRIPLG